MCNREITGLKEFGNGAVKRVENIQPGDHVCCIYNTNEEHRKLLAPFMMRGLKSNEKTFYIVDTRTSKTVLDYLRGEDVAIEDCISTGKMSVLTYQDTYMRDGVFDPDKMIRLLESETAKALCEGYSALRVTGEMTWALRGLPGSEKLMEYESKLNYFFPKNKVVAICQYDARCFSPEILLKVLETHPLAIIGAEIYENFYYIPPEEYLSNDPKAAVLHRSINNLTNYKRINAERKKAELTLLRSETKYRALFANMLDGFAYCKMLFDNAGKPVDFVYLEINDAFERLTGLKKEVVVGRKVTEAIPGIEKTNPELFEIYGRVASNGKEETFEVFLEPLKIWLSIGVYSPQKGYFAAIFENITKRKVAETEISLNKAYLESILNTILSGIIVVDAKTHEIVDVNSHALTLLGANRAQVVGEVCHKFVCPAEQGKCPATDLGESILNSERVLLALNGDRIPIIKSVIRLEAGETAYLIENFVDISERKKDEIRLKEDSRRIELMNEKLRVSGSLTRHDVQNKLAVVSGNAYLLKKKHADEADVVDGLIKMEESVAAAGRIFEFAKLYEQLGVEELLFVDVEQTVNEATALFPILPFKVVNDCNGLTVWADSFLRQLFYNLIDNTKKYGQKTTTIKIHYEKATSGNLQLIYEDDGVGIPKENKSKLFTEGFSTGGSTGFGLFLIKKMMEVYGWTITEEGEPGKSAKFVIQLPPPNQLKGKWFFKQT